MNTKQIADEAVEQKKWTYQTVEWLYGCTLNPIAAVKVADAHNAAIEKATEEGVEIGSMLMAGEVVKAFTEGGRFGFTDENDPRYKLNQILDSSAAHASEKGNQ